MADMGGNVILAPLAARNPMVEDLDGNGYAILDLSKVETNALLGTISEAEINKLDGAGLFVDNNGELRVDSSVFDGTISGISNPLTENLDASGYDIDNVGSVSTDEATNKVIDGKVQAGHPDFANPNEALDFANSNGYDKIEFPPGDYTNKSLEPYDGQTVIGHNAQSVIFKAIDGNNGTVNWTIRDIGFSSDDDKIDPLRSFGAGCSFENCIVFNTGRRGINVGADQTSVKNVRIPNTTPNDAIEIFAANCSVEGCVVNGTIVDAGTNNSVGDGNVTY